MRKFSFAAIFVFTVFFLVGCTSYHDIFVFPSLNLQAASDVRVVRYPGKANNSQKGLLLEEVKEKVEVEIEQSKVEKNIFSQDVSNSKKSEKIKLLTLKDKKKLRLKSRKLRIEENDIIIEEVAPAESKLYPDFVKGIYLSNYTIRSEEIMNQHIADAKKYGINTFVIDVQPKAIDNKIIKKIIENDIFPVARVVVFEGGLKDKTPSESHIQGILNYIDSSAKLGFKEVQLDYIRYADYQSLRSLSLDFKYKEIDKILKRAQEQAAKNKIFISADLFGRITLNYNDHIGQKLELFANRMDTLYPMLYPSHYYFDDFRTAHPYETVKEGVFNSIQRINDTKVIAYIQGFHMYVDKSGLSFQEYVRRQMQAVEDAKGHGWIIWNPYNKYESCYLAMLDEVKRKKVAAQKIVAQE